MIVAHGSARRIAKQDSVSLQTPCPPVLTVLASNLWDSESWSCLLAHQEVLGHLAHVIEALLIWGAVDDKLVGFSLFVPC